MKKMKRLIISMLIITLCSVCFAFGATYIVNGDNQQIDTVQVEVVDTLKLKQMQMDSIKQEMVFEVTNYIKKQAPKSHDSIPSYLVEHSIKYNIDLCFMMGQTQLETNFGTSGAGRESSKRSLFGVHIYPGTKFKGYPNYDVAIEEYCKLLRKSYLVKGRDEHYLMRNYVNRSGNHYATAGQYEANLRIAYNTITKSTPIDDLQKMYKSIAI